MIAQSFIPSKFTFYRILLHNSLELIFPMHKSGMKWYGPAPPNTFCGKFISFFLHFSLKSNLLESKIVWTEKSEFVAIFGIAGNQWCYNNELNVKCGAIFLDYVELLKKLNDSGCIM